MPFNFWFYSGATQAAGDDADEDESDKSKSEVHDDDEDDDGSEEVCIFMNTKSTIIRWILWC